MAKKRTSPIGGVLDITNPEFLKQYAGQKILSKEQGKVYEVGAGGVSESAFDPQIANQHFAALFGAKTGLQPTSAPGGGYATSEAFKYFLPQAQETARIATGDFGAAAGGDPIPSAVIGRTGGTVQAAGETGIVQNPNAPIGWGNDPVTGKMVKITPTTEGTGWYDEVTGKDTPVGVGTPRPTATPIADQTLGLQAALDRNDPNNPTDVANIAYAKSKGLLATLTSPTGEKVQVAVGSQKANNLFGQGYTLGDKVGGGTITPESLAGGVADIDVGNVPTSNGNLANQQAVNIEETVKTTQEQIKANQELLKAPESDLSAQVSTLLGEAGTAAGELTGRGGLQASEEEKRQIEQQQTVISDKTTELNQKMAEVKALDASFNLANQQVEGKPITLASIQGQQAQNYKMYLAQKNVLVSEASYMQAEVLGLQGKLDSAQKAADRAVDLEYLDREAEYNAKIKQLELLLPQLEGEEERYASAMTMVLNQQADALTEEKATKKQQTDYALTNMNNYKDAGINLTDDYATVNAKVLASPTYISDNAPSGGGGDGVISVGDPIVDAYVKQVQAKEINLASVPSAYRNAVAVAVGATPTPEPPSPLDPDLEGAARVIISMEQTGVPTDSQSEAYWGVVSQLAEDLGLPQASIDPMLINMINKIKGVQSTTQTEPVEENIGSDFDVEAFKEKGKGYFDAQGNFIPAEKEIPDKEFVDLITKK